MQLHFLPWQQISARHLRVAQVSETISGLLIGGNNLLSKRQEKRESCCQLENQCRRNLLYMPEPWEILVWSPVKDETQAHRKLAFIISKAQGATCFLFNPNSSADSETNVATTIKKVCYCSNNSLYLFPAFVSNLILKWQQWCLTRWGNPEFPSFTLHSSHMGIWTFLTF